MLYFKDPNTKVKEFMESKPLLSDFDAQIKYYQRLETQIEELPGSYHIGPVEYLTERIKEALITETKAWKQSFGKALAEKVTTCCNVQHFDFRMRCTTANHSSPFFEFFTCSTF